MSDEDDDGAQLLAQVRYRALPDGIRDLAHLRGSGILTQDLPGEEDGIEQSQDGHSQDAPDRQPFVGCGVDHETSFLLDVLDVLDVLGLLDATNILAVVYRTGPILSDLPASVKGRTRVQDRPSGEPSTVCAPDRGRPVLECLHPQD
jgi:hypothetical protein